MRRRKKYPNDEFAYRASLNEMWTVLQYAAKEMNENSIESYNRVVTNRFRQWHFILYGVAIYRGEIIIFNTLEEGREHNFKNSFFRLYSVVNKDNPTDRWVVLRPNYKIIDSYNVPLDYGVGDFVKYLQSCLENWRKYKNERQKQKG